MDSYEKELLARVVEACRARSLMFVTHPYSYPGASGATACAWGTGQNTESPQRARGDTLADALTALLSDLGEPVPWRPSAEDVAEAGSRIATLIASGATCDEAVDQAVEDFGRLAVEAALLEGGGA